MLCTSTVLVAFPNTRFQLKREVLLLGMKVHRGLPASPLPLDTRVFCLPFSSFQSFSQVSDLKLISKEGNQWEAPLDTWGYFSGALNCTHSLSHTHRPGVHVTVSPVSCCSWIFPGYQPRALVSHYRALGCKHHHSPHPHMQLCASQQPL